MVLRRPLVLTALAGLAATLGACAVPSASTAPSTAASTALPTSVSAPSAAPSGARSTVPSATAASGTPAVTTLPASTPVAASGPKIVKRLIPYSAKRKQQMAGYAKAHYGVKDWRLRPTAIVLHFTESNSVSGVISQFARNAPNRGEAPGTCAHYLIAKDGTIYELVPPSIMCRHAIGLNHKAIGIEMIQTTQGNSPAWADRQILARKAQARSLIALVKSLQATYKIQTSHVYGHAGANKASEFKELKGWRNDHQDFGAAAVAEVRRRLSAK